MFTDGQIDKEDMVYIYKEYISIIMVSFLKMLSLRIYFPVCSMAMLELGGN